MEALGPSSSRPQRSLIIFTENQRRQEYYKVKNPAISALKTVLFKNMMDGLLGGEANLKVPFGSI